MRPPGMGQPSFREGTNPNLLLSCLTDTPSTLLQAVPKQMQCSIRGKDQVAGGVLDDNAYVKAPL